MSKQVCLIVVLYNPSKKNLDNLIKISEMIDCLILIDNSSVNFAENFFKGNSLCEMEYISTEKNVGIASALNIGVSLAEKKGYEWVVTSDQDSVYSFEVINHYKEFLSSNLAASDSIGLITPRIFLPNSKKHVKKNHSGIEIFDGIEFEERKTVITSGNLININAWKCVAGYDEHLFIDSVDFDFCLKLQKGKYKILEFSNVFISHEIGEMKMKKIGMLQFQGYQHNSLRKYYMYRNHIILNKRYYNHFPVFILKKNIFMLFDFIKIIIFEDEKKSKIINVFRGIYSGLKQM